jgi:hypothetical protein
MPEYDPQLAERLAEMMRDFPEAKAGRMFGMPGYLVNGKLAVGMFEDSVVAKLGAARAKALIGSGGIEALEIMPGRVWKDWVKFSGDLTRYREVIGEAVAYVAANT